jgi:NAD(P)-dependent dehydrogenase (short-subunit alcohol dehydrogenase family)
MRIAVAYRADADAADSAADAARTAGGDAMALAADVSDRHSVAALVRWGTIDVLVNNAGVAVQASTGEVDEATWNRALAVNLTGAFLATAEVLPLMQKEGYGRIVNVASLAGRTGGRTGPHYAAAKGGLIALTKAVALEYAGDGIRCNVVLPASVRTALARTDRPDFDSIERRMAAGYPLGRLGEPEDVAAAIRWLADPGAGWITGAEIRVDGGFTVT